MYMRWAVPEMLFAFSGILICYGLLRLLGINNLDSVPYCVCFHPFIKPVSEDT